MILTKTIVSSLEIGNGDLIIGVHGNQHKRKFIVKSLRYNRFDVLTEYQFFLRYKFVPPESLGSKVGKKIEF